MTRRSSVRGMRALPRGGTVAPTMPSLATLRAVPGRFADPSAWPPVRRDWLVVAAWLAADAVDVALENKNGLSFTDPDPTPWQTWPFLVVFAGLLLWRHRSPLVVLVGGYAVLSVAALAGGHLDKGFMPIAQMAFFQFCAARAAPGRREVAIACGVGVTGVAAASLSFGAGQSVGNFLWATVMLVGLSTAAARAFRQHETLSALLNERAAQLEVQRDERARLAVAQERERIAGELHDVVAHGVSAMGVQAGAARRLVAARGDTEQAHEAVAGVEASGRAALDELRRLLGVLRRGDEALALAPQPSLGRVDRLVARLREEGFPVHLDVEGEPVALPPGLDVTAYRIVEETLGDLLRAGGEGPVQVRVRYGSRSLGIAVADATGVGSAAAADLGGAVLGLRERVTLFGGELHAGTRRGGTWTMEARLPVERVAG